MAINITSNFNGDVVEELMSLVVDQNELVEAGLLHIESGIKKQRSLMRLSQSNIIQSYVATPVSGGDITLDERVLDPSPFLVYVELNPLDLDLAWPFVHPTDPKVTSTLTPAVQKELGEHILIGDGGVNEFLGNTILNGTGAAPEFNGLITRAIADAEVIDVAGVVLTSVNILAEMQKMFDATRIAIRKKPTMRLVMSNIDFQKYREALVSQTQKGLNSWEATPEMFNNLEIFVSSYLPENTMFTTHMSAGRDSNVWAGVRGDQDSTFIEFNRLQANSDLHFFKMSMEWDTQIKFGADFVLYQP